MQEPNKLLKTAVDQIVHLINDTRLPAHAAVVKTAKELDLNVHFIKRACEVVNVALTYEHFRKNAEAREKDFPIVDAQKVAAEVFAPAEKSANQKRSEYLSGTMVEESVPNFRKAKHDAQFRDQLGKLSSVVEEARGMSDRGICEKAALAKLALNRQLEDLRTEVAGARLQVENEFATLVNHWSKDAAARIPFSEFEAQAFSRYGEQAVPYLDFIHKSAACREERGEHDAKYLAFDDSHELQCLGRLFTAADNMQAANTKLAELTLLVSQLEAEKNEAYSKLAASRREEHEEVPEPVQEKAAEEVAPAVEETEDPVLAAYNAKLAEAAKEKQAAGLGDTVPGKLFSAFSQHYKNEASGGGGGSGGELGNLDRKLLIQNLMATDPILRTYEPKRVADSYEQFLRLAPELSNEKEIVRSHLRQMVASQAMTAFDGAQLMDTNTKLVRQKQLSAGGAAPAGKEDK